MEKSSALRPYRIVTFIALVELFICYENQDSGDDMTCPLLTTDWLQSLREGTMHS